MESRKYYFKALTIAGSDSGGGAGIQADLKTFSANGVYGMSAITAITAQNTKRVIDIQPVPSEMIRKQIAAVVEDMGVDAVKIGMLHSSEVIIAVVETLKEYQLDNIVVDPVMVATSGDVLLQDEAISSLINELLPMASVITPNLPEAEIILNTKIRTKAEFIQAVKDLGQTRARAVLLKAGHFKGKELTDILYIPENNELLQLPSKRIETENTHGTGCTLSSAIAAHLARGKPLKEAIKYGIDYIHQSIRQGARYKLGQGHGPVHHFYKYWN
jgi:hydroxymethylpyrimidine/phosphomethylpyrimidine kinase